MAGFEYFSVAVSVILSFGALRLLDALPFVFSRERRYWPHALWVVNLLLLHVHIWWVFWGWSNAPQWTYREFVLLLAPAGLLYALAGTLVTHSAHEVASWREHFWRIRVRLFTLLSCNVVVLALGGWIIAEIPLRTPLRVAQASLLVGFVFGALSRNARFHAALPALNLASLLMLVLQLTLRLSSALV